MPNKSLLPDEVARYVHEAMTRETPLQKRLREETARLPRARMQIAPDQAALLAMLVRLTGARRALEIGTFTGYSALAMAGALPPGGTLLTCDVSEEWTKVARRYWAEAGVAERIDLRLGPATETLAALAREGLAGTFDLAFIDADKENYDAYYEACLGLLRPGGLIVLDNMLWKGAIADPAAQDPETRALRSLSEKVHADRRVDTCLLTVGDGMLLARKRLPGQAD
jgi:predicted O-methyltransferase YrrM